MSELALPRSSLKEKRKLLMAKNKSKKVRSARICRYQLVACVAHDKIHAIEATVQIDPGKRGISVFTPLPGELLRAAQSLFRLKGTSNNAAIITGFPCVLESNPPTETDGPLGAVAIARAFLAATAAHPDDDEADVPSLFVLTDHCNEDVLRAALDGAGIGNDSRLKFQSFPPKSQWTDQESEKLREISVQITTSVAIERAGPGQDGGSYTMGGHDMSDILAPLHELMEPQEPINDLPFESVGIGDGGNEVGMGKVWSEIQESTVPFCEKVACVVPADHLIVCGVSNWGGNALAAAMTVLHAEDHHAPAECWDKGMPTETDDIAILDAMVGAGARDGCSRLLEATVDGLPFEDSLNVSREIKNICTSDQ